MTLFGFRHAQKNAFAFFVALSLRKIAVGLRGLDFRLPVAHGSLDCLAMVLLLSRHAALKLNKGQTASQKLSARSAMHRTGLGVRECTLPACSVRHPAEQLFRMTDRSAKSKMLFTARWKLALPNKSIRWLHRGAQN